MQYCNAIQGQHTTQACRCKGNAAQPSAVCMQDSYLFFISCCPGLKASFDSSFEELLQLLQASNGALPLLHWEVQPHTPLSSPCVEVMTQGIEHLPCMFATASLLHSETCNSVLPRKERHTSGAAYLICRERACRLQCCACMQVGSSGWKGVLTRKKDFFQLQMSTGVSYAGCQECAVTVCLLLSEFVYTYMQHEGSRSETTCEIAESEIGCMLPDLFGAF